MPWCLVREKILTDFEIGERNLESPLSENFSAFWMCLVFIRGWTSNRREWTSDDWRPSDYTLHERLDLYFLLTSDGDTWKNTLTTRRSRSNWEGSHDMPFIDGNSNRWLAWFLLKTIVVYLSFTSLVMAGTNTIQKVVFLIKFQWLQMRLAIL